MLGLMKKFVASWSKTQHMDYDNLIGNWEGKQGTQNEGNNIRVVSVNASLNTVTLIDGSGLHINALIRDYVPMDIPALAHVNEGALSQFGNPVIPGDLTSVPGTANLVDSIPRAFKVHSHPPQDETPTTKIIASALEMGGNEQINVIVQVDSPVNVSKIKSLIEMFNLDVDAAIETVLASPAGNDLAKEIVRALLQPGIITIKETPISKPKRRKNVVKSSLPQT